MSDPIEEIEKENKRAGHEWDAFMREHGRNWDDFSIETKNAACDLAEKQGYRLKRINDKYKIRINT